MPPTHGRILVVEDSAELRELLVFMLEDDGFAVFSCDDAKQAFAIAQRERPDLILTDLMLGATSGLELITRVRSDLVPPVPPIIVCSGFTGFEREALQRGSVAFIPKPFDLSTIRRTVTTVLARQNLAEHEREEAAAHSRTLRVQVIAAAKLALGRIEKIKDLVRRGHVMVDFVTRYFGFGDAFYVLIYGDRLQVTDSSNPRVWRPGQPVDLALCRDIMETSSALLVPDLQALGAFPHAPDGTVLRFFTGLPLFCGSVSVGALCFADKDPRRLAAEDYSVLETLGRRASAIMSARESEVPRLWGSSDLMSREGLCMTLTAELRRMARRPLSLGLFVFEGSAPRVELGARTVLAELGDGRFAALLTRDDDQEARQPLLDLVGAIAGADGFCGGGLVKIEDGGASSFDARSILHAAEGLLERALQATSGTIERIIIRREPHAADAAAPRDG